MPASPTYPGVYIEEVSSGVHTITGVATSITAFIGRARMGPVNEATTINSFGDFERSFGGLGADYPMSYTVRDFYFNGGSQAVIVRLQNGAVKSANADLKIEAATEGAWGDKLTYKVDYAGITDEAAKRFGIASKDDLFNLTVFDNLGKGAVEVFRNVAIKADAGSRRLDRVLVQESGLVRVQLKNDGTLAFVAARPGETTSDADPSNPKADPTKFAKFTGGKDGDKLTQTDFVGVQSKKTGLYALEEADLFNLLCIPPDTRNGDVPTAVYQDAMKYCVDRRALLIVDPPTTWNSANSITANSNKALTDLGLNGDAARNAALYFPRVTETDPLSQDQADTFVPCGIIAGVMARTDTQRGVWKAPAGLDAAITGVQSLAVNLTDPENGQLNPLGVNCLRTFPAAGRIVWGARTLRGADQLADEYKYVPVRRTALFIEESLYRGTKWVVFEPNDEPLWAQIRLNLGAFMQDLFRKGAFQGKTPREAYLVKCDSETTTQNDINLGIVNIVVGFAPLKPAEFVVIKLQQLAGQIEV